MRLLQACCAFAEFSGPRRRAVMVMRVARVARRGHALRNVDTIAQPRRSLCTVPNEGSEARDHLANERTFLAWARTGMAFVGLGVAADQMKRAQVGDRPFTAAMHIPGLLCVGTGGFFLGYATWRYFAVQSALRRGKFPINRGGVLVVVGASSVATMLGLTMLLAPEAIDELHAKGGRVH